MLNIKELETMTPASDKLFDKKDNLITYFTVISLCSLFAATGR
jgi:hypothetical protein